MEDWLASKRLLGAKYHAAASELSATEASDKAGPLPVLLTLLLLLPAAFERPPAAAALPPCARRRGEGDAEEGSGSLPSTPTHPGRLRRLLTRDRLREVSSCRARSCARRLGGGRGKRGV
jgi:hypothetical protein